MNELIEVVKYLTVNGAAMAGSISTLLFLFYGLSLLIPGDQPDKAIKKILDFTKKLSRK